MQQLEINILFGIAGNIICLISVIVSIVTYFIGKKRVLLKYDVISTDLIENETSGIPGLDITFNGEVVPNLTLTKVKIYNHGNCVVCPSDFRRTDPLRLTTTGNLFYSRINSVPHKEYMASFINRARGSSIIDFDFLKPKDSLTITVLHSGEISISGELITGMLQRYYTIFEKIAVKIDRVLGNAFFVSVIAGVISSAIFAIICLIGHALSKIVLGFFGISI